MDRFPGGNPDWLAALSSDEDPAPILGDPYYPIDSTDSSEPEEDPSEDGVDPEEVEPIEDEGILVDVPIEADILNDAQPDDEPKEDLSEEEVSIPPSPTTVPYFQPYLRGGKGPMMRRTPGSDIQPDIYSSPEPPSCVHGEMSAMPRSLPDITPFLTQPTCGLKRKATDGPTHREIGESSQAPPPDISASRAQSAALNDHMRSLEERVQTTGTISRITENRVERLREEVKEDASAIQTLFHRVSAGRTEANVMGTRFQTADYENRIVRARMDTAERRVVALQYELRQLREQFDELVQYLTSRL